MTIENLWQTGRGETFVIAGIFLRVSRPHFIPIGDLSIEYRDWVDRQEMFAIYYTKGRANR
ncbi:hypothetical protein [Chamaesiphon sp. OTE_20_metabat_361]|uniref:hypothetical protein n=1 Tax=Chamaesiphon sp. OTE_20_metabat_361 TaxID=2964689 RepID=UPI00286A57D0|nr:hypothetical protein [Chamaesiphon sp. OTE_20_metabat_361]